MLLRLNLPGPQLPTMWLKGKFGSLKGQEGGLDSTLLEAIGTIAGEACWWPLDSSS